MHKTNGSYVGAPAFKRRRLRALNENRKEPVRFSLQRLLLYYLSISGGKTKRTSVLS